jgi:hypothetical protein
MKGNVENYYQWGRISFPEITAVNRLNFMISMVILVRKLLRDWKKGK